MDLFQHRYYRLSKTLMTLIGQWPYQSIRTRRIIRAVLIFLITSSIVPQILGLIKYRNNGKIVLEAFTAFLFVAVCVTKLICSVWNSQKTSKLLNHIRTNWKVWACDREINILHEYAEQGEKIIILYAAMVYSTSFLFMTQPAISKTIDILLKNGSRPGKFPYPVDYYHLDVQKYYFYIIAYLSVCVYMGLSIVIASDVMLITYVQHVCSIFAALGHKLEGVGTNVASIKKGESLFSRDKRHMFHLASCIDRHNDAIEFADLIEATYTWSFLFIVGIGMIMINAILLQILLKTSDPEATMRLIPYVLTGVFHFYIECYISQILIDHSIGIHFYIHNSQWYRMSPKAQKLVQLITMRCGVPCQLTAGNRFVMCVRTFGEAAKTCMSYFTIVRTMQI